MSDAPAQLRTTRLITAGIGLTMLVAVFGAMVPTAQRHFLDLPSWHRGIMTGAHAITVAAGLCAPWLDMRWLKRVNAATVISHALVLVLLLGMIVSGESMDGEMPWNLSVTGVAAAAAVIAWGTAAAWWILASFTVVVQTIRLLLGEDLLNTIINDSQTLMTSSLIVLLSGFLLVAARNLDQLTAAASAAAVAHAEELARRTVTHSTRLLVHDEVLQTLLVASRGDPNLRSAVAAQAARTRRLIREIRAPDAAAAVGLTDFVRQLKRVVCSEDPIVQFGVHGVQAGDTDNITLMGPAAAALLGATRQAVVNSVAHAGVGARRRVSVQVDAERLRIAISDDGVGFDIDQVAPARLGLQASILGRLRAIPGGSAHVSTRPGKGTIVVLGWKRDEATTASHTSALPSHTSTGTGSGSFSLPDPDRVDHSRGVYGLIIAFVVLQSGSAVLASARVGHGWVHLLALVSLFIALGAIGWSNRDGDGFPRPSLRRSVVAAGMIVAVGALSVVPSARDDLRYGDTWYLAALAYVLLALIFRGRIRFALASGTVATAIALVGALVTGNDSEDVLGALVRAVALLALGSLFATVTSRLRVRTLRLRSSQAARAGQIAWRRALHAEQRERARALEELIGEFLETLESGVELSTDQLRQCLALEGQLRDEYRGTRLTRGPVIEAARAARMRGVDVVLHDDDLDATDGRPLNDDELGEITRWMAAQLDAAAAGKFVGRILPAGQPALASAVHGDESTLFRG